MEIKTKYNIGDEVWFMRKEPCKGKITSLFIYFTGKAYVTFVVLYDGRNIEFEESELFPTKEELLASL